jgi:hypothetical protein
VELKVIKASECDHTSTRTSLSLRGKGSDRAKLLPAGIFWMPSGTRQLRLTAFRDLQQRPSSFPPLAGAKKRKPPFYYRRRELRWILEVAAPFFNSFLPDNSSNPRRRVTFIPPGNSATRPPRSPLNNFSTATR